MPRRHGHSWASCGVDCAGILFCWLAFACWWLLVKAFLVVLLPHAAATDWLSDRAIRKRLYGAVWLNKHRPLVACTWAAVSVVMGCTHARYQAGLCVCLHALRPRIPGSFDGFCRKFEDTPSSVLVEHVCMSIVHACVGATLLLGRCVQCASSYSVFLGIGAGAWWKFR